MVFLLRGQDDAEFDKDIIIPFWSKGMGGVTTTASSITLAAKELQIHNTNGD